MQSDSTTPTTTMNANASLFKKALEIVKKYVDSVPPGSVDGKTNEEILDDILVRLSPATFFRWHDGCFLSPRKEQ